MSDFSSQHWFFVRGLSREAGHWGPFLDHFRARFPKAEVSFLDLPGNGKYWRMKSPMAVREMSDFVRQDCLKQHHKKVASGERSELFILAMSLGAMVTVDWMTRFPREVRGAVLVNSSLAGVSPFYRRFRPENVPRFLWALLQRDPVKWEKVVLQITSSKVNKDPHLIQEWIQIKRNHPIKLINVLRQLIAAATFQPAESFPDVPVLVLNSLRDQLVHPSCSRRLGDYLHADIKFHPTAGHDLPLDDAPWILNAIEEWVNQFKE